MAIRTTLGALLAILTLPIALAAQQTAPPVSADDDPPASAAPSAPSDREAHYKKFAETMSGAKLIGNFTIDGAADGKLIEEEYTIVKAEKMPKGDYWLITARIKYGKNDVTIPMPLEVKWAEKTPVITLDKVTIPGLGTFSSRVVIDGARYAGTWQHDDKGGHLFGKIERAEAAPATEEKAGGDSAAKKEDAPKAPTPSEATPPSAPKVPIPPKAPAAPLPELKSAEAPASAKPPK